MDCLENEDVCSVRKENDLGYYRIHTHWMKDHFRVNIASKNGAWTGEMTRENVTSFSNQLEIDPEKYIMDCKEALTSDGGKKGYTYMVENGAFTWKKIIDEDCGIKVKMGSILLKPASFPDTVDRIIEVSLKCKENLLRQVDNLLKDKEREFQRAKEFQMKLKELLDKKNLMEIDLYNKFLLLLNAKKRRIRKLEAGIPDFKFSSELLQKKKEKKRRSNSYEEPDLKCYFDMETEDEDEEIHGKCEPVSEATVSSDHKSGNGMNMSNFEFEKSYVENNEIGSKTLSDKTEGNLQNSNLKNVSCTKNIISQKIDFPATKNGILDFFFS